ncbi:M56 family metallopeptidase [Aminipila luticellarii]|uniref:DUF4825 domain-containing protein n=1 Tax=Aminipila luticellarii TaxID=2507160 RepID=A0A410PWN8_9FIRM|nr:M56 family metallopeptidase [Aminipila luticellarii]QAT43358.1 DUF4825 domain-containing protein [Aminipila luticellarii]
MDFLIHMTMIFSVTTILILAIKLIFKNKFTPGWHVFIWVILMVRLASPMLPESDVSVFNFVPDWSETYADFIDHKTEQQISPGQEAIRPDQGNAETGLDENTAAASDGSSGTAGGADQKAFGESPESSWFRFGEKWILTLYWAGGAVLAAGLLLSYGRLLRRLKHLPLCRDAEVLGILNECQEQAGIGGKQILLKEGADSPILAGIFRPVIYISEKYEPEEIKHVFYHELCHYKGKDNIWNALAIAVLCFNWFNPLAWYAFKTFKYDLEVYCDYRAVRLTGERKAYAELLLKTVSANSPAFFVNGLESGEKEVSRRIKKLAYFKSPKLWGSIAGLLLIGILSVFCLTNASDISSKKQLISVCGPANEWGAYMLEVPLSWGKDYEEVIPEQPPYSENVVFHDKNGKQTVELTYKMLDLAENETTLPDSNVKSLSGSVDYEQKINQVIKQSGAYSGKADQIKVKKLEVDSSELWEAYQVKYWKASKLIRTEIYLIAGKYTRIVPVLCTENDKITGKELIQTALTLKKVEDPSQYRPKEKADMLTDAKTGIGVPGGAYDVSKLIQDYLQHYVDTKMPPDRAVKAFKIYSLKEITPAKDIPGIIDEGVISGESVPWHIIYPTARVYQVDYELIPEDKDKYADTAGGGFEMTKEGHKHYQKSYAVFYSYLAEGSYEAVFLGFLHESSLAEYGMDYSVLSRIDGYYEQEILPQVLEDARVQYVGDPSAVGKLLGLLPLHEYTNGMELQTKEEPYGITVNYKIGRAEPYDMEAGGALSAWPEKDGDLSGIYSKRAPSELNFYIERQLQKNTQYLFSGIDNVKSVNIICESPYLKHNYKLVYKDPYNEGSK